MFGTSNNIYNADLDLAVPAMITGSTIIPSDIFKLWWPVKMGPQTLYYLTINLLSANNQSLATVTKRVGSYRPLKLHFTLLSTLDRVSYHCSQRQPGLRGTHG